MTMQQTASLLTMLKPAGLAKAAGLSPRGAVDAQAGVPSFASLMAQQFDGAVTAAVADVDLTESANTLLMPFDTASPETPQDAALKTADTDDSAMAWGMPLPWMPPQTTVKPTGDNLDSASTSGAVASGDAVLTSADQASLVAQVGVAPDRLADKTADASVDLAFKADVSTTLQAFDIKQAFTPTARTLGASKSDVESSKTKVATSMEPASGVVLNLRQAVKAVALEQDKGLSSRDAATALLQSREGEVSGAHELVFSQFLSHAAGSFGQVAGQGASASGIAAFHTVEQLSHPVGSSQFVDELVGRVGMFVRGPAQNGPMTAELHLNPTEMGPVQVRIEIDGAQAQVHFMAQHADTRHALEASLSSLGDNLRDAGLQLTQANVSDSSYGASSGSSSSAMADGQSRQNNPQQGAEDQRTRQNVTEQSVAPDAPLPALPIARGSQGTSGLDMYA